MRLNRQKEFAFALQNDAFEVQRGCQMLFLWGGRIS
jgi:hypothetical protein